MKTAFSNKTNQKLDQLENRIDWFHERMEWYHLHSEEDIDMIFNLASKDYEKRYGMSLQETFAYFEGSCC